MDSLFGIPMGVLMVISVVAFLILMAVVVVLAARSRTFFKMAMRNIPRRRGRTFLILSGLMLGTLIISAALSTGDTISHTVRSSVVGGLGNVDEILSAEGSEVGVETFFEGQDDAIYFDEVLLAPVEEAASSTALIDGVAPAIIETVAVVDVTTRQNEPRMTLFAMDPMRTRGFGEPREVGGGDLPFAALGPEDVYLNEAAADELEASPGDELLVFVNERPSRLGVAAIVSYQGAGTDGSAMLMSLSAAQALLGRDGQVEHILVSNRGDALSGAANTVAVLAEIEPVAASLGLNVNTTKQDALEFVDSLGSVFAGSFLTFGMFSIITGIMLIALIFVMLAAERRSEMGMARAIGTKRRHLVQMFLFEGVAYSLVASSVGALLGIAVAYGMVFVMAEAFSTFGVDIRHDFRLRSLVVAYTIGMLLTFAVVLVSSWRVSVLNIVTAIRDLPEPAFRRGRMISLLGGALALLGGGGLTLAGYNAALETPFYLGLSFVIIGLVPVLRRFRLPDRGAYTIAGVALVLCWLLLRFLLDPILPEFSADISIFIVSGVMTVIGGAWTVMYNSDLILRAVSVALAGLRWLSPILKVAISYPLMNRFRTGMTVAMFSLVVFTLVVMATLTSAFSDLLRDEKAFGGGFDIRATTVGVSPVENIDQVVAEAPGLPSEDLDVVASQSVQALEMRQADADFPFQPYPVRGADDAFLAENSYEFALLADGFDSDQDIWRALRENRGLAVIDPSPVPSRNNFGFGGEGFDLRLEGFFLEDDSFSPVDVEVTDPGTGRTAILTIIGVLKDSFPPFMLGLTTSEGTLAANFGTVDATTHFFRLKDAGDVEQYARALESAFLSNGMEADILAEELGRQVAAQVTFNYILQGFMGLGLVVGVAALGVISARAVVERRQQIGVLRAIGFRQRMVQLIFLLESSYVALLGIFMGSTLGLILAFNIIRFISREESGEGISFAVPWVNLIVIFLIAYGAALLATLLPSREGARIQPSEALRYE